MDDFIPINFCKENLRDSVSRNLPFDLIMDLYLKIKSEGYSLKLNLGREPEEETNFTKDYLIVQHNLYSNNHSLFKKKDLLINSFPKKEIINESETKYNAIANIEELKEYKVKDLIIPKMDIVGSNFRLIPDNVSVSNVSISSEEKNENDFDFRILNDTTFLNNQSKFSIDTKFNIINLNQENVVNLDQIIQDSVNMKDSIIENNSVVYQAMNSKTNSKMNTHNKIIPYIDFDVKELNFKK